MKRIKVCSLAVLTAAGAVAQSEPFQASLTPDIAMHDRSEMIEGLTLSVWGENPQKSLAIGIVNGSTGDSAGFALGFLLNYADAYTGVQWAPVNFNTEGGLGWQAAFLNYTEGAFKGVQTGAVNYAGTLTGLQLGLLNFTDNADTAIQIGIVNIIRETTEWFSEFPDAVAPGMVFVNWRF
jgi:hypothetical protein